MKKEENYQVVVDLRLDNSYGLIKTEDGVELDCTVGVHEDGESGWFEAYDVEEGGEDWYMEGGLEIEGKEVVGYDGCFELPSFITDKLVEMGYSVEDVT